MTSSVELLVNVTPNETRIALLDTGVLKEVHIEREAKRGLVGNIYKGRVMRVLPGMQSAFVDVGRAWGGSLPTRDNAGWLGDVGVGLRVVSERSSFGTVVHIDIALPLRRAGDVSKLQFQVKAKRSF